MFFFEGEIPEYKCFDEAVNVILAKAEDSLLILILIKLS